MQSLAYRNSELYFENQPIVGLAGEYGTPLYVYSMPAIEANFQRMQQAFSGHEHLICYAYKANSNPAILKRLAELGAGADVVSLGELKLALQAGVPPEKIVFAGVGKRDDEIEFAVRTGIRALNVESEMEMDVIAEIAQKMGVQARISLRLNPDIDIHGHPYITTGRESDKFGIRLQTARSLMQRIRSMPSLKLVGLHAHIGSQITELAPFVREGEMMRELAGEARQLGHELEYIDVGGGLGIRYEAAITPAPDSRGEDDLAIEPAEIAQALLSSLAGLGLEVVFEPGRSLVANAGVLLTQVLYLKDAGARQFVVVDAGMTELIRPSLYQAYHAIVPATLRSGTGLCADVVGPICESGDFFARARDLPPVQRGDILAVLSAGAYGFSISSNYNARPRPAELLITGEGVQVVREREAIEDIWS